ncbi:ATP-binding protein [Deinococcus apachensis]|uniref:ATP-binding protein n=1 Tax=Deinococcus apachensis TaxID=309886 RepID=UPI00036BE7AC|nr:AAA family ATPase [Deinococcus apachensis]
MSELPFVGREQELARLETFLARALTGQGQVCFVTGEAGGGKTALVQAFARRAQDADEHLAVASGNCNAQSGVGDPYLPFRELLGVLVGVAGRAAAEPHPHEGRLRRWLVRSTQVLIEVGPDLVGTIVPGGVLVAKAGKALAQKAGWLDELEKLAKRKPSAQAAVQPEHLLEQYANVLRALASERPLLLIVDDLHWADAASVDLLFHLSRRLEGSTALLVGTYRPHELYRRGTERHPLERVLAEIKRYAEDVWVDLQVGETEGREFVNHLLDTEPNRLGTDFREALFRHTEGHPLFTVELLRSLQERGDLVRDSAGCLVVGPRLEFDTLPSRVEGVIEQRIGHLEEAQQEVLRVASVEGETFTAEVVAQVQGLAPRPLLRDLSQHLEGRHGLVREGGELRAGRRRLTGYRFAHTLFQHYLYGELGQGERRLLHGEVGQALEELYAEAPDPVVLAWHYDRAGEDERAAEFYRQAGEQAIRQGAPHEAERLLTRGLELTPERDVERRFELLLVREKALDLQGQREPQLRDVAALERLAEALDDDGRRCQAALRRVNHAQQVNDLPAAFAAAEWAMARAVAARHRDFQMEGDLARGGVLRRLGRLKEAESQLRRALQVAGPGAGWIQAAALHELGWVAFHHDLWEAQATFEQVLALYRQIGDLRGEQIAVKSLGIIALNLGDFPQATTLLRQSLAGARRLGDRRAEVHAELALGVLASNQRRFPEARALLETALEGSRQIGERQLEGGALLYLSRTRLGEGECVEAERFAQMALELYRRTGIPVKIVEAQHQLAYVEAVLGNLVEARALFEAAIEAIRPLDRDMLGHLLEDLAELELCQEHPERALELARQIGLTPVIEEARALLALERLEEAEAAFHAYQRQYAHEAFKWIQSQTGLIRLEMAKARPERALRLVEALLPLLEQTHLLDDWSETCLACFEVLWACGDARAASVLEQGWRLLERQASKLDGLDRERFVNNIPGRRGLAAAWRAAGARDRVNWGRSP